MGPQHSVVRTENLLGFLVDETIPLDLYVYQYVNQVKFLR